MAVVGGEGEGEGEGREEVEEESDEAGVGSTTHPYLSLRVSSAGSKEQCRMNGFLTTHSDPLTGTHVHSVALQLILIAEHPTLSQIL